MTKTMAHLPHRAVLEIHGEDKSSFLQGLITNNINQVNPNRTIYAALLTPQGRYLYDFFIYEKEDSYFLDTDASRIESLLKKLTLYKLRSRVNLKIRPDLKVFALWGEGVVSTLGLKEERGDAHDLKCVDPRLLELGVRMIAENVPEGFEKASLENYTLHRLLLGVPEGDQDLIPEKSILLESGLGELQAISWTKGCYMGQELTARTKYRGLVRKRIFPVKIEGEPPSFGAEIFKNGVEVGEMRSHQGFHGLALLRIEFLEGSGEFMCEKAHLFPHIPSWMKLEVPAD